MAAVGFPGAAALVPGRAVTVDLAGDHLPAGADLDRPPSLLVAVFAIGHLFVVTARVKLQARPGQVAQIPAARRIFVSACCQWLYAHRSPLLPACRCQIPVSSSLYR